MSLSDTFFAGLAGTRNARKRYSGRGFYLVVLTVLAVTLGSLLVSRGKSAQDGLFMPEAVRKTRRSLEPGTASWAIEDNGKEVRLDSPISLLGSVADGNLNPFYSAGWFTKQNTNAPSFVITAGTRILASSLTWSFTSAGLVAQSRSVSSCLRHGLPCCSARLESPLATSYASTSALSLIFLE